MEQQVIYTADGSTTVFLPEMEEQYHSVNGAITESVHVYIERGYLFHKTPDPIVLEIGFGTGLNCFLTALKAEELNRPTFYYSIDKYPLPNTVIDQLNYAERYAPEASLLFNRIHECSWNEQHIVSKCFTLCKLELDLVTGILDKVQPCHVVYFDAFGPDKQPEMWTETVLAKVADVTLPGGVISTYSAKGEIKRKLISLGYQMEKLAGPPGKKEMLRGIKS